MIDVKLLVFLISFLFVVTTILFFLKKAKKEKEYEIKHRVYHACVLHHYCITE